MKKKGVRILFIVISLIVVIGLFFFGYQYYLKVQEERENKRIISEITNSYSKYVNVEEVKKLYRKRGNTYQEVGTIYPNTIVSLVEKEVLNKEDIYYQIENSEYYLDYQNIRKVGSFQGDTSLDHYLVTKKIKASPTKLYQDGKIKIDLKEPLEFEVLLTSQGKNYVKYLGDIYYLQDSYELIEKEEKPELLNDISILNFSDDITDSKLEEVLKYLKENNYQGISIEDFERWIKGEANLGTNKVLLLCYQELNESKRRIQEQYGLKINTDFSGITFTSGDTKLKIGDTRYYKYEVLSNTTLDRVKDMLNGIKEKKPYVQKIAVLNYHFFYDESLGESCNESICLDVSNFRKQLEYLKNNGYKTLTMAEFNDWMDRKIILPQKSVLITIDDGSLGTGAINGNKLIPILEEYQMYATLFLVTEWYDVNNYQSPYLEVESHGHELHHNDYCNDKGCGIKGLKISREELINDLQTSINKLGTNLAFCYPFYARSNNLVQAVKSVGFQLAFGGGNEKASQYSDKYNIPRYVIYKNTSLSSFAYMVN